MPQRSANSSGRSKGGRCQGERRRATSSPWRAHERSAVCREMSAPTAMCMAGCVRLAGSRGGENSGGGSIGLSKPSAVRGATLSILEYGRASPSLRQGWTKAKRKSNINQELRLTHEVVQKSEPVNYLLTLRPPFARVAPCLVSPKTNSPSPAQR